MSAASIEIPVKPVYALLDDAVARSGKSSALDFMGRRWTYAELGDLVDRAACGFRHLGVRRGVRVGLCLPNSPYYVICYFAVLKAGGIVVNYNPLYVERELKHQIDDSGTTIMVTIDLKQVYPKVAAQLDTTGLERIIVCKMSDILPKVKSLMFSVLKRAELADIPADLRHIPFADLVSGGSQIANPAIDPRTDVAVLQYTGGTTGVPKGAMLTHANLSANVEQIRRIVDGRLDGDARMMCVLPFFHVFAMTVAMNFGILIGAELILLPRFDIKQVMATIAKKRPTMLPGVPTLYTAINGAARKSTVNLSSIQFCMSGGAPLPIEVCKEFERLTGCSLVEGYGLTESSPVATCNPLEGSDKEGSIGVPIPGTRIEVRSPENPLEILKTGEKGEIVIHGPQVMAGYWQRPEDTKAVMVEGGLRTGDVGYIDEDGFIFLVDRIKDLIICSGYNVYPRVIEEAIYRHPAVAEAVVIAIPDEYRGQAPKAFVRLKDGAQATQEELKTFLADQISRLEMPKTIEFRRELPKTMVGKLSKKVLIDEELAANASPAPPARDAHLS